MPFPTSLTRTGALALALLLAAAPARAAPPDDTELTLRARAVLLGDAELADRNLFLRVHGGVATLTGEGQGAEQAERAVALVRAVPGVRDVQVRLTVVKPRRPAFVLPPEDEPPTQTEAARPDPTERNLAIHDRDRPSLPQRP